MLAHCFHALGRVCKFVLRCKNLYRIGPRSLQSILAQIFLPAVFGAGTGCGAPEGVGATKFDRGFNLIPAVLFERGLGFDVPTAAISSEINY